MKYKFSRPILGMKVGRPSAHRTSSETNVKPKLFPFIPTACKANQIPIDQVECAVVKIWGLMSVDNLGLESVEVEVGIK